MSDNDSRRTLRIPSDIAPDGIVAAATLQEIGLGRSMIAKRCRPGGPWQRPLPGVVMLGTGPPSRRQQLRAAIAYGGPNAVITGVDALRAQGVALPGEHAVRLLLPASRRITPKGFLEVERSTRMPSPILRDGMPFAPPTRAAIDLARSMTDPVTLRRVLAVTALHGLCSQEALCQELEAGNQRGSAGVRLALRTFDATAAAAMHAQAHRVLTDAPLPPPRWNVTIYDRMGRAIGYADAWWDEVGLAWQLGQLSVDRPRATHAHHALTAAGAVVVRTPAEAVRRAAGHAGERLPIVRELAAAFRAATRRPRPNIEGRCLNIAAAA